MRQNVEAIVNSVKEAAREYFEKHQLDTNIAHALTLLALDHALKDTHLGKDEREEIFGTTSVEDLYLHNLFDPIGIPSNQRGGLTVRYMAIVRLAEKRQWESAFQPPDIKTHPGYVPGGGHDTLGWLANRGEDPLKTDDQFRPRKRHKPK